eukprot:gene7377-8197_t
MDNSSSTVQLETDVACSIDSPSKDRSMLQQSNDGPATPEPLLLNNNPPSNNPSVKRSDYLSWPDYFMAIAFLSAQRSKDPSTQVGACIVNDEKKIVGIGYNGMPLGCDDDKMPWGREGDSIMDTKHAFVCHAEMNAILNKNSADVKRCTIYVALFPCNECTKLIIQAGIKEVIYYSDKYHDRPEMAASRKMLDMAKIEYR